MWNVLLEDSPAASGSGWEMWLIIGIALIALVVFMLLSGRKNKNSRREYMEQLDAIGPGNKVKTAGGICGIVVEVCDDNTFIIETGSEKSGKSYIKMDRELIAQTDAKGPTQIAREEAEAKRKAEKEAKEAAKRGEAPAAPAEEKPAEAPAEEKPAETPAEEQAAPSEEK